MESCKHQRKHIGGTPLKFYHLTISITLLILTVAASTAFAENWYIKPSAEIPVRRGQGTDYKILVVLENGTQVSIVEENDPWVKIQTLNGTEGWMLKRYLTNQPPLDIVVDELRTENSQLQEKEAFLSQKLSSTEKNNSEQQAELSSCLSSLNKTKEDFKFLEEETADVIAIKNNLTKSEQQIEKLSTQLQEVIEENDFLKRSQQTKWFLAGVGTLVFGWLVGHASARSKKRRSTLY